MLSRVASTASRAARHDLRRSANLCTPMSHVRSFGFFDSFKKSLKEEMKENPELKEQLDSLRKATEKLQKSEVSKTVGDAAKSAEQKMRDLKKGSGAEEYSSKAAEEAAEEAAAKAADRLDDTGKKVGQAAETAKKSAAAAKEKLDQAYEKAQEKVQQETERLEADNADFKNAKEKVTEAADRARKMKENVLGEDFFSNFKSELYTTTRELFSLDSDEKKINKVLKTQGPPPTEGEAEAEGEGAEPAQSSEQALMVVEQPQTTWEQITSRLQEAPIIQGILGQADKVRNSEVGAKARAAQNKINDATSDAREFWETSQNPWVYRVSNIYEGMFGETEMSTAVRELRIADPEFNVHEWSELVQAQCLPEILEAYLKGDSKALGEWCSERMVRSVAQIQQDREAAGLSADPHILEIETCELVGAQVDETGPPILLLQGAVQQVHCLRNRDGEIVEGGEDNIEQCYYYFAFQRNLTEEGELKWECVEFVPILKMDYL